MQSILDHHHYCAERRLDVCIDEAFFIHGDCVTLYPAMVWNNIVIISFSCVGYKDLYVHHAHFLISEYLT